MTVLLYPENRAEVALSPVKQREFIQSSCAAGTQDPIDWLHLKKKGTDYSMPQAAEFRWDSGRDISCFCLSDSPDFTDPITLRTAEKCVSIPNLRIAQTYYWKVDDSEIRSFTTADVLPRWIHADGITNVRDCGGWKTQDGRRVRQGLIYRGSEMDSHVTITEEGIRTLRDTLGIRTDLDLRGEAVGIVTESPLGKTVDFRLIPVRAYSEFLLDEQKDTARRIFALLADASAYPIYYHCWGGADRTGTIAYLLNALLGVPEEDLILDYELTSLSIWGDRRRSGELFTLFENALKLYDETGTPRSRTEKFLRSCGVSEQTLQQLRDNLLE